MGQATVGSNASQQNPGSFLGKARRRMHPSSATSANGLFLKLTAFRFQQNFIFLFKQPDLGGRRASSGGPPPSDGERLDGAAGVAQPESPEKPGPREVSFATTRTSSALGVLSLVCPSPGWRRLARARRAPGPRGRARAKGKCGAGPRAAGAHLPADPPPQCS